jgi:hypothetical protein
MRAASGNLAHPLASLTTPPPPLPRDRPPPSPSPGTPLPALRPDPSEVRPFVLEAPRTALRAFIPLSNEALPENILRHRTSDPNRPVKVGGWVGGGGPAQLSLNMGARLMLPGCKRSAARARGGKGSPGLRRPRRSSRPPARPPPSPRQLDTARVLSPAGVELPVDASRAAFFDAASDYNANKNRALYGSVLLFG